MVTCRHNEVHDAFGDFTSLFWSPVVKEPVLLDRLLHFLTAKHTQQCSLKNCKRKTSHRASPNLQLKSHPVS